MNAQSIRRNIAHWRRTSYALSSIRWFREPNNEPKIYCSLLTGVTTPAYWTKPSCLALAMPRCYSYCRRYGQERGQRTNVEPTMAPPAFSGNMRAPINTRRFSVSLSETIKGNSWVSFLSFIFLVLMIQKYVDKKYRSSNAPSHY